MSRKIIALSMALTLMLLSGCQSRELQLFTIVTGMGIDCEDGIYSVTLETGGQTGQDGEGQKPALLNGSGQTITQCLADVQRQGGKYPYLRHSVVVVLCPKAVEESLENTLDYVINEHNMRLSAYALMSETKSADIFSEEDFASRRMISSLSSGATTLTTTHVMLEELMYNIYADGIDGYLPLISQEKTEGIALLSGFKMTGKLDARLTPAFLMTRDAATAGTMTVEEEGQPYTFKLLKCKGRMKTRIEKGQAVISVDIDASFRAEDRLKKNDDIYEAVVGDRIKRDVGEMVDILKEAGSDAIGAGQYLCRHDNRLWKEIREDWPDIFKDSRLEVTVKVTIDSSGKIKE